MPIPTEPDAPLEQLTTNLPFDTRIRSFPYGLQYMPPSQISTTTGNTLQHGYLVSAVDTLASSPATPQAKYQLHFLYNPSEVTVSHSASSSNTPLPAVNRPDSTGTPIVGTGGSLSWNLLYDRTYEVNDPTHPAYYSGVLYDVTVLYGLVGITTPLNTSTTGTGTDSGSFDTSAAGTVDVTGVMQNFPVWASFGLKRDIGARGMPKSALSVMKYFGYVSTLTVTYTHWTQSMIPDRCAIGLGMTLAASNGFAVPLS